MHYSSNSNSKLNLKPKLKLKCKPKLKPTLKPKLKFQIKLNQSHRSSYTKLKLFKTQTKVQDDLQASHTSQVPTFQQQLSKIILLKIFPKLECYKLQKSKTKDQVLRSSIFSSFRKYILG